jgi:4-aminobutyrate aminotransferase / (S)-3-amino-2-methylpropionate transaminase / 5-aminovalerate transaminase
MSTIKLVTEIPGPRSRAVMTRREAVVPRGIFHATPIVAASASGATVQDVDGNTFLDFAGGIGVLNVGHAAPPVVTAVREQLSKFTHTCFSVAAYESYVSLAERLVAVTPGAFPKKVMFANSGAEGIENAVKIARVATGRPGVLCFEDAFHGRTLLTLSLTSKISYKAGMAPFVPDVLRVPYGYCYRCAYGLTYPSCKVHCATDAIEDAFRRHADPSSLAAVVVEPVLGEGGFVVPPREYLGELAAVCRRHGILVIADEVQTGFGRTGRFFACEHFGVEPDLLVTAKSLAAGLPLAAVVGRSELMDAPGIGGLGGTYGGNPLALAAAHAVLDMLSDGSLIRRAETIGRAVEARARLWADRQTIIGDIRRLGGMVAMELVEDRHTRAPAPDVTAAMVRRAAERGVILMPAGTYGNVIRVLVPLVVTDEQLTEGLDVIEACLAEVGAPV